MKSKKLTSVAVIMMSLIIMLGIFVLPASAATSLSKATVTYTSTQTYTGNAIKPKVTVKVGKTTLKKDTHYTVAYKNNKNVGKATITVTGKGSYSGTVTKYFYIKPKAVDTLKATAYPNKIKLEWNKVKGAKSYQVYQYKNSEWKKIATTTDLTYTVTGLSGATTYKFKVRPYTKVGDKSLYGDYKSISKVTTLSAVSNLKATAYPNKIKLSWSKVSGAKSYQVYQYKNSEWKKIATTTDRTYTVTGLSNVTTYKFKVRPYAKVGDTSLYGGYESISKATTVGKVTSVAFSDVAETTAKLKWNAYTGAKSYRITYINTKNEYSKTVTSKTTSVSLSALTRGTTYEVIISALNSSDKIIAKSDTLTFKTAPAPVKITGTTFTSDNSLKLTWSASTGASGYKVSYAKVNDEGKVSKFVDLVAVTATNTVIKNLPPASTFIFKVVPFTNFSSGTAYGTGTQTEKIYVPIIKISNFKSTSVTKNSASFKWSRPTDIDGYKLYKNDVLVATLEPGDTTYTFENLAENTTYKFGICAYYKTADGEKTTVTVTTASGAVSSVAINNKRTSMTPGESFTLSTTVLPSDATDKSLTYESSNSNVATVSSTGTVTAKADGTAKITVKSKADSTKYDSFIVTVTTKSYAVSSVAINNKRTSMTPGESFTLSTTVLPSDATDKSLTYESSNSNVVAVSSSGTVTAKADGTATITVKSKADSTKYDSFIVTVASQTGPILATSISLPSQITMYEGDLISLNPTFTPSNVTDKSFTVSGSDYSYTYEKLVWEGFLPKYEKITDTCKFDDYIGITTTNSLKANKETVEPKGDKKDFSFTVTVTTTNGKTATTQVTVKPRMMTILYNGMEDNPWYYGNSVPLSVALHSDIDSKYADSDILYKSSNTSIATVTSGGVVNCKSSGDVTITAYTKDNKYSATYEIYIHGVVSLEKSYFQACQTGKTYQIKASIIPSNSNDILMYYSLNEDVATVAPGGLVTFRKAGNALIAVTTSSNPYKYEQVWLTSGTYKAPTGSNAQLLSQMKTAANSAKTMTDLPNVTIKEKHIFDNLKASTTTGTTADISSLESTIESIFKPKTTALVVGKATKDDFIKHIPIRNQSYVIASNLSENDIQSIKVTDNGEYYYEMTITLKEETLSSLPTNPASTRHGKVFEIITKSLYDELKAETGLNPSFDSLTFRYHDCSLTLKVNKITGNLENTTYNMITDASVKSLKFSTLVPALNASATYTNIITVDFSGYKN